MCDSLVFSLEFRVGLQKNDPTMNLITILKTNIIPIINYGIEIYGNDKYTDQIDKYV